METKACDRCGDKWGNQNLSSGRFSRFDIGDSTLCFSCLVELHICLDKWSNEYRDDSEKKIYEEFKKEINHHFVESANSSGKPEVLKLILRQRFLRTPALPFPYNSGPISKYDKLALSEFDQIISWGDVLTKVYEESLSDFNNFTGILGMAFAVQIRHFDSKSSSWDMDEERFNRMVKLILSYLDD